MVSHHRHGHHRYCQIPQIKPTMKLTYNPRYNIAYIALRDKTEPGETPELAPRQFATI